MAKGKGKSKEKSKENGNGKGKGKGKGKDKGKGNGSRPKDGMDEVMDDATGKGNMEERSEDDEEEEESDTGDQVTVQTGQREELTKAMSLVDKKRLQDGRWADDEIINSSLQ
jgi:hypothetical protein